MSKLLIVVFAALIWTLGSIGMAQDTDNHDCGDEPAAHDEHHDQAADLDHDDHDDDGHDEDVDHDGHEDHDGKGVIELGPAAVELGGITLATVGRGRIGRSIDLPGEVGFDEDRLVNVAPRFPGIAKEVRYRVGDYVNAGDVIAIIESNESLSTYEIKATISGWIIKRYINPGEFVSEENSIYVIADLSKVWVNLAVYPRDAEKIKPGLNVHLSAVGSAAETVWMIDYVTPVMNVETRSITARVVIPNTGNTWRPGTFVRARVKTDPGEDGLIVEKNAVQVLDDEHIVFVTDGPGRFKPVPVAVGGSDTEHTRILAGLEQGMSYVATGAFELKAKIVTSSLSGHAGHGH